MELEVIKALAEKRNGGIKKLAADIDMSEQNLHRCIRNNKIQASDLEKISALLQTDIRRFFNEAYNENSDPSDPSVRTEGDFSPASMSGNITMGDNDALLLERIKHLEALLAEKERTIEILMRIKK